MMIKQLCRWASAGLLALTLAACQTASLEAPGIDRGQGTVTDFSTEPNIHVAFYQPPAAGTTPDLKYGSMDANFITIDDVTYMVEWNDTADFKSLKKGEKLNFRATGMFARKQTSGQNYRVILLNEM